MRDTYRVTFTGAVNKSGRGEYVVAMHGEKRVVWVAAKGTHRSRESMFAALLKAGKVPKRKKSLTLLQGGLSACPSSAAPC